jgi:hypothetical protein
MKLTDTQVAAICHNANKTYCETIGDFTQAEWTEAPDWQQISAVKGVVFNRANPEAPPSASHESWLKNKYEEGWKWGPAKNENLKTHPCCMPFGDLPLDQQRKDKLFKAIVNALAV